MKYENCNQELPKRTSRRQVFFICPECGKHNEYYSNPFDAPGVRKWTNRMGWGCGGLLVSYVFCACTPAGIAVGFILEVIVEIISAFM